MRWYAYIVESEVLKDLEVELTLESDNFVIIHWFLSRFSFHSVHQYCSYSRSCCMSSWSLKSDMDFKSFVSSVKM